MPDASFLPEKRNGRKGRGSMPTICVLLDEDIEREDAESIANHIGRMEGVECADLEYPDDGPEDEDDDDDDDDEEGDDDDDE